MTSVSTDYEPISPIESVERAEGESETRNDLLVGDEAEAAEDAAADGTDEEQEYQMRKQPPDPKLPSAQEIEDHRLDHFPFRNWCPHCMAGRALGEQRGGQDCEHKVPIIGLDYFFVTKERIATHQEALEELGVDAEGLDEAVRKQIVAKILTHVHGRDNGLISSAHAAPAVALGVAGHTPRATSHTTCRATMDKISTTITNLSAPKF